MTILVDDMMTFSERYQDWCHLWSSTLDDAELHAFADALRLKRTWFQVSIGLYGERFKHYDISPAMRARALSGVRINGALIRAEYKPLPKWLAEWRKEKAT